MDTSRLCRRGDTDAFSPILLRYGDLRMRDGDRETLRDGDKGGFSHVDFDVGVLGTLCRVSSSLDAIASSSDIMHTVAYNVLCT